MVHFNIGLFFIKKKKKKLWNQKLVTWLVEALISFECFRLFVSESTCTRHPWCTRLAAAGWLASFYDPASACAPGRSTQPERSLGKGPPNRKGPWGRVQPTGKVPGEGSNQPERSLGKGPEEARIPVLQARGFGSGLTTRNWKRKSRYGNSNEDINSNCVR